VHVHNKMIKSRSIFQGIKREPSRSQLILPCARVLIGRVFFGYPICVRTRA
jgi:hypothetical protein